MAERTVHRWTDEERDVVRREYSHTHRSRDAIARKLGVSPNTVQYQVGKMGLAKKTDRRPWTREEEETLRELVPQMSLSTIAKRMGRSLNSVTVRANRLRISRRERDGWFTKKEVCEVLGVDHHWVQRRIDNGTLRATWHHGRQPQKSGQGCWHIAQKDLKTFLRRYPEELNGRNVDLPTIVEVLAGLAPTAARGDG